MGPEATELIAALGIGIQAELTDEDIHATIFAHPTLSEAIHESMLASGGNRHPHVTVFNGRAPIRGSSIHSFVMQTGE